MTLSALDDVLRTASSVRVSEIEWYGEIVVDLTRPGVLDGLRAAMAVESLPGVVCACRGQVRFEFFDAHGERLTVVVLHHGIMLAWQWESGHADLADGAELLRWLGEHGLPGPLLSSDERPEWQAWKAAIPPALEEMAGDLVGHWPMAADSKHVVEARERMRSVDSVTGVLQLLAWCAAGMGNQTKSPPYEDVPGLVLRDVPIAEIVAALHSAQADERHDVGAARILLVDKSRIKQRMDVARLPGPLRVRVREAAAARGYELPQWAERLLLNA
ncbi:hypothetical protein SAMN04488564_12540 [Lentzea waywayandensis]|uniref:Uncharacterized protein n=1 Tax=Lentzea waywayandensis TaxID=84724 RepID=A0A1I6FJ70_9PSEU|nr:hypothetical protein [Lentzea waywayandensis]SFR29989.1 hypothetical protein SAMN04488564_12540 [Lentzea waywayandensis]